MEWLVPSDCTYEVIKESVDARRGRPLQRLFRLRTYKPGEEKTHVELPQKVTTLPQGFKPVAIVGSGPAGLFCAIRLLERGVPCVIYERGHQSEKRIQKINRFWRYNELDPDNNVAFGEGGAGLYSDGKLVTRIKSEHIPYVLSKLVAFGAPQEILYKSNPHVGSDRIRRLLPKMRDHIRSLGGQIAYDHRVQRLIVNEAKVSGLQIVATNSIVEGGSHHSGSFKTIASSVVLATGHGARDVYEALAEQGVTLEAKSYAIGLRVEHPQSAIDRIQYREWAGAPTLGAANYKLTYQDNHTGQGVYSFCMCPGGYVLSSGTDSWGVVSNGMSNYNRNSGFANAAIVTTVDAEKLHWKNAFDGLKLRDQIERDALNSLEGHTSKLPAQRIEDFLNGSLSHTIPKNSSPSGAASSRLDLVLPPFLKEPIRRGLQRFNRLMPGFLSEGGLLFGVETRTSAPLRIPRNKDTLMSVSHEGLYPCGEGAGYAGGITSAAVDGVRVADKICESIVVCLSISPDRLGQASQLDPKT